METTLRAYEVSPEETRSLMDLPDEVLEHVVTFLDGETLCSFAYSHPRLSRICQEVPAYRLRSSIIHVCVEQYVDLNSQRIRALDFSNCLAASDSMKALMLKCPNVEVLNVVGSVLSAEHLFDVLDSFQRLHTFSATITEVSGRAGTYAQLRKIYVEFPPDHDITNFVFGFLEHCLAVKEIHINIIGRAKVAICEKIRPLSHRFVNTCDTIVLSTDMQSRWQRRSLDPFIFTTAEFNGSFNVPYFFTSNIRWYEKQNFDAEHLIEPAQPGSLTHLYQKLDFLIEAFQLEFPDRFRSGQIALRVEYLVCGSKSRLPEMGALSCLKELDFTGCHLQYTSEAWQSLVDSGPAVEALALPFCSLFVNTQRGKVPEIHEGTVKVLRRLKLKKLYVESLKIECTVRKEKLTGVFSKYLCDFQNLVELTLNEIPVCKSFFESLVRPCNVSILKLNVSTMGALAALERFLRLCPKLLYLKLETPDLPIHESVFWDIFVELSLKQLCLSSGITHAVAIEISESAILQLMKTLDILHVHGERLPNGETVSRALQKIAAATNRLRTYRPISVLGPVYPSMSEVGEVLFPNLPGRSLCCTKNFIARIKRVSWDIEL